MASNPYVNKVVYGGNTLIDLTSDTVEAAYLASGKTAHKKDGSTITGTAALVYNSTTEELTLPSWSVVLE